MNGAQDLGGMMGFGPIAPEKDEPFFHAAWEKRAMAVTLAMGATGSWPLDAGRYARESLPPADYLSSSYYEIWIKALIKLMLAKAMVSEAELAEGQAIEPAKPVKRVIKASEVPAALAAGTRCDRPVSQPARFAVGEGVRARNEHKITHTRLPRYARGHLGTVVEAHGMFVLPDTNAHGEGENPEWLYTVRFTGTELWGPQADPTLTVMLDLWESYLDPA
ncbi:nitrile hydratase subunit beta [Labrys sp. ZIDIC5]|uniref:nitrile hydratase subunit beta n=1 Tax=Labrys sedimenti TaxID=3106036 RepID=UPI002ACA8FF2|nr:nitrile hydratase subunit beta [Labrys sp. ZIDIC5]MDZ5453520.1 nitrile hydratase subunit beta [Labrys sp. ZIDIC5]